MNRGLDGALIAVLIGASAVYAATTLGPKTWRRALLRALAALMARAPKALRSERLERRIAAAASRASAACGGCGDGCGSEPTEHRVSVGSIGRLKRR